MDSDEDVAMDSMEQSTWTAADKGKGKAMATEQDEQYDKENLPWCAHASLDESLCAYTMSRVEKYRPVTLDDVVSHKDITGTSE